MSVIGIWTKPLRGGRYRVLVGRLFIRIKISSARTTVDDNIRTVLKHLFKKNRHFGVPEAMKCRNGH
jgi:hypothetical protein